MVKNFLTQLEITFLPIYLGPNPDPIQSPKHAAKHDLIAQHAQFLRLVFQDTLKKGEQHGQDALTLSQSPLPHDKPLALLKWVHQPYFYFHRLQQHNQNRLYVLAYFEAENILLILKSLITYAVFSKKNFSISFAKSTCALESSIFKRYSLMIMVCRCCHNCHASFEICK